MFPVLLNGKLAGEAPSRVESDTIAVEIEKKFVSDLKDTPTVKTLGGGKFQAPDIASILGGDSQTAEVDMKVSFTIFEIRVRHM